MDYLPTVSMKALSIGLSIAMMTGMCALAVADEAPPRMALVPIFDAPPQIDGVMEPGEWDRAVAVKGFMHGLPQMNQWLDHRLGAVWFGFCEERLYLAVVSALPPDGQLVTERTRRDSDVVFDDSIEIWIDPYREQRERDDDADLLPFYQFIGNSIGTLFDVHFIPGQTPRIGWDGNWEFANTIDEEAGVWVAELSLPWEDIGWEPGHVIGRELGLLIARNYKRPWTQASAWPHSGSFYAWQQYPRFRLTADTPAVQMRSLGGAAVHGGEQLNLELSVNNPGATRTIEVDALLSTTTMPDVRERQTFELSTGQTGAFKMDVMGGRIHDHAEHTLDLRVRDVDRNELYFGRRLRWTKAPDRTWHVRVGPNPDAAVRLAYYPSHNFIRLRIDPRELEAEAHAITAGQLTLRNADGEQLLETRITWQDQPSELKIDVPELPNGTYTAVVALDDYDARTFERDFERIHYVWEHTQLGKTTNVYPPFDAMEVDGADVSVVLRNYSMGQNGLWDAVETLDRDILARPMRYVVNGNEQLEGSGRFTSVAPHEVVFEAQATHPGVRLRSKNTIEYDGCMKVELELLPGENPGQGVNSLWVEIPLKDSEAPLWHVTTTSIRHNPVGYAPEGEGKIWDSRDFPDGNWMTNFKPYIWLGDEARGLAWFADNDRGWVLDIRPGHEAPAQSLHRIDGELILRIHLIQRDFVIDEPREIVFGLMASPGKPMPEAWRRTFFDTGGLPRGYRNIAWMGSTYWGASETMNEKYPFNKDMSPLSKMQEVRLTGDRRHNEQFIRTWADQHLSGEIPGAKDRATMMDLLRWSLNQSAGRPDYLSVYWEEFHYQTLHHPETRIFGNEWSGDYSKGSLRALPPSYLDFAAWYAAEFIRRGIGIYFDNTFPKRSTCIYTTEAYRMPDGSIQPSATMWRHRDYYRRIWVLHQELGPDTTKPLMMHHMTNANILPFMTWNESNLDLEWFYGPEPQQSKYSADMLRAQATGRHTGTHPLALAFINNWETEEERAIAHRTRFGALMVHEVRARFVREERAMLQILLDFGYGLDDCRVFNYWQDDYPVATSNDADVKSLLLKKDGDLLMLLATWNSRAETVRVNIDAAALGTQVSEALDTETGAAIPVERDGLELDLNGYDVRILRLK